MARKKSRQNQPQSKKRNHKPKSFQARTGELGVIRSDAAGIDVGSEENFVCAPAKDNPGMTEVLVSGTTTAELLKTADWLAERKVRTVALESTGVYWIALFEVLESRGFEVLLTDTRALSRVPGRKTDMIDCQWIQLLHAHGLLKGCFRPEEPIVELRSIVRAKLVMVRERADWLRRMQKCLDQMNVRVHRAVTRLDGVTGMKMVRAIVAGERDPKQLAKLREPGVHKSEEEVAEELRGHWRSDHLFGLGQGLKMYDWLSERIEEHETEILRRMKGLECEKARGMEVPPVRKPSKAKTLQRRGQEAARRALFGMTAIDLTAIDGVGIEALEAVVSEYGPTLEQFPDEKAFVSHVRLAPSRAVTGGKAIQKKRGQGRNHTRVADVLRMAANAVAQTHTALGAYFRHTARTKDRGVAVFATARKLAQYIYRALRWGQAYIDEGVEAYERRYEQTQLRRLAQKAAQAGYDLVPKHPSPQPA